MLYIRQWSYSYAVFFDHRGVTNSESLIKRNPLAKKNIYFSYMNINDTSQSLNIEIVLGVDGTNKQFWSLFDA